jgi:hypothetical protein
MSSIGVAFESWNDSTGIDTTNGAVFWMDPTAAPDRSSMDRLTVVAQLTTPTGRPWTATMGVQGKSQGDAHDWEVLRVEFTNDDH